ncbi:MAG: cytochrome c3 family protein [Desulfuromonadales bacterium]
MIVLVCGSAMLPVSGHALQIVHPADGTYLYRSGHLIVKGGDTPMLDGVAIEINGVKSDIIDMASPAYRKAFRDFLIVQADYDEGENRLVVEGYAGGKRVAEVRSVVYLANEQGAPPPVNFRAGDFHLPEREALCHGCHNMNPTAKDLAAATQDKNPCGSCHGRMLDRKHVHGPAGVYDCTYCHAVDSRPAKYAPRSGDAGVCTECHEDKIRNFKARKAVHGPIDAGMCLVCHDPHGSDQPAQLHDKVNQGCNGCHENIQYSQHVLRGVGGKGHPLTGPSNPRAPQKPFDCTSCHDPHGGAARYYFQGEALSRMTLCLLCHKK